MSTKKSMPRLSVLKVLKEPGRIKNPLPFQNKSFTDLGDTFTLKMASLPKVVFSRDATFAEYALQKNQKKYAKTKLQTEDLVKYVGKGLLTSEGEHWRKQRKLIQPAFHKKQLINILESIRNAVISEYKNIEVNKTIDVFPILNDLAFQTVVKSLFSGAANTEQINRSQQIVEAVQRSFVKQIRQPYLGWWFKISGFTDKQLKLTAEARDILKDIVEKRRASKTKYHDLLDMLLDSKYEDGTSMEERQLIDEILILFVAGHETTSNALTFAFQLLALHPEWQERIYEETQNNKALEDDLMSVIMASKTSQQVVEETLRLYPPAYLIDRANIEEDSFDGYTIESNTYVVFSIYEIHRHPKLWDEPHAFKPERFKDGGRQYSSHYFPFGAGPRKCIGNNFAMYEMIIALNEIVKSYKITTEIETIGVSPLLTLKPENALLRFEKR